MDIKMMHDMIEKLTECAKAEIDKKGIEEIDAGEFSKVTDMIKDLAEAMYYRTVTVAMEEYGEDDMGDEGRMYYRGQPRSRTSGRFMKRGDGRRGYNEVMGYEDMTRMRDMDREGMGRMYYSGSSSDGSGMSGGMRGYSESRSENARRGYMETKEMHKGNAPEDKQKKMRELEKYMQELSGDITEMIGDASPEEKNMLKSKLQTLASKVQ